MVQSFLQKVVAPVRLVSAQDWVDRLDALGVAAGAADLTALLANVPAGVDPELIGYVKGVLAVMPAVQAAA